MAGDLPAKHGGDAESALRQAVLALPVDEVLALCYAFKSRPERLRLYLDVLRNQGGERAQFASCLVCYDLGRQGDLAAQSDFGFLATVVHQLRHNTTLVQSLVGDDDYLGFVWDLCAAQLDSMDDRFDVHDEGAATPTGAATPMGAELASLDLLSDDDFEADSFEITVDLRHLEAQYCGAMDQFLGAEAGKPIYDSEAGFRLRNRRDTARVERFVGALDSFREPLSACRGMRALTCLFFGTHMRSRTFFGSNNTRKERLLQAGLAEFLDDPARVVDVVGVFGPMHAGEGSWAKVAEVMFDFVHHLGRTAPGSDPLDVLSSYPAVQRQTARDKQRKRHGRRRVRR